MLLAAYTLWAAYFLPLGHLAATLDTMDLRTSWDRAIPLVPWMVWIYDLCYLMPVFAIFAIKDGHVLNRLIMAVYVSTVASTVMYFTIPIAYPIPEFGTSLSERFLDWQFVVDFQPGANKMPSLHVSNAFVIWIALRHDSRRKSLVFLTLAVLIAISTLLVKKHLIADVFVGMMWAAGAWWIAGQLYRRVADRTVSGDRALLKMVGLGRFA